MGQRLLGRSLPGVVGLVGGVSWAVWAQMSATGTAIAAALSPADLSALRQLEVPIVTPTVLPPNTYVDNVTTTDEPGPFGRSYTLYYRIFSPDQMTGRCFQIEYSSGGFGGPVPQTAVPIQVSALSAETFQLYEVDPAVDDPIFAFPVFSDWIMPENGQGGYRLTTRTNDPLVPFCEPIAPETAVEIVESLDYWE